MSIPTFNKFKSTTVYGAFNNLDYEDNSIQASANIQRNLTVGGDIVVATGNVKGKKLFYDNVDISSTFVSNTSLTTTLNSYSSLAGATFYGPLYALTPITSDVSTKVATTAFVSTVLSATLSNYALLSNATFTGPLRAITQGSTDNSTLVATTAYVKGQGYLTSASLSNYALSSTLSSYALLSGATFTGNVSGLTPITTDNSTTFATTAFVKAQNYISSNPDLSPYALLSGATFTGNVSGLTAITSDNTTKFATTAFVKNQNYITSSALSPYALASSLSNYALSSALSNYALSSGATFTGIVNCNNGLTTASAKDVHISCNNTFPTTNSGGKQGLGFFWNKSGGVGEVNLLCYGQGGSGGLNIWNSNVTNVPTKLVEFFPSGSVFSTTVNGITPATSDNSTLFATTAFVKAQNYLSTASLSSYALLSGATFTGAVNCNSGLLNVAQPSSTQSPILQFVNDLGQARALIYPSVGDSVLRFSIMPNFGTNGFEWEKSGTTLMSLDSNGNLSIRGSLTTNTSSSIPPYSTITVPTTNTHDNYQGSYYTTYSVRPTNSVNTLNGVSTVNIGIPFIGGNSQFPNFNPITISSVYFALGTLANPDTPQNSVYCVISSSYGATPTNTTNFFNINMYNVNGTRIRGYGTLLKSFSTNSYSIIFVATDGVGFALNTSYYYDPFQFTYV